MQDFTTVNICNTVWEWGISVNSATGAGDVWDCQSEISFSIKKIILYKTCLVENINKKIVVRRYKLKNKYKTL